MPLASATPQRSRYWIGASSRATNGNRPGAPRRRTDPALAQHVAQVFVIRGRHYEYDGWYRLVWRAQNPRGVSRTSVQASYISASRASTPLSAIVHRVRLFGESFLSYGRLFVCYVCVPRRRVMAAAVHLCLERYSVSRTPATCQCVTHHVYSRLRTLSYGPKTRSHHRHSKYYRFRLL